METLKNRKKAAIKNKNNNDNTINRGKKVQKSKRGGRKGEGKKKKKKRKEVLKIGRMANGARDGCCVSSLDSNREMLEEVGVALHFKGPMTCLRRWSNSFKNTLVLGPMAPEAMLAVEDHHMLDTCIICCDNCVC